MKVGVLGGGIAGLSCAIALAGRGHKVTLIERHSSLGGRARSFHSPEGFVFDRGPSWYWMPDVFERFFSKQGANIKDYLDLRRLDPSYSVIFKRGRIESLPANIEDLIAYFEHKEKGSGAALNGFLRDARTKYVLGMRDLVYQPSLSWGEYMRGGWLMRMARPSVFRSMRYHVNRYFESTDLRQLMEFPTLFLGASPTHTPALYSLMNYADMTLGTWYPMGGIYALIMAMKRLAQEKGVSIELNTEVECIEIEQQRAKRALTSKKTCEADAFVAAADYWHVEQNWLPPHYRNYSANYWKKRKMAPSALLFYLGINKKIDALTHHNLFFDANYEAHMQAIYNVASWPTHPLFYVCAPSRTDPSVAPKGCENLFVLIPVASDLSHTNDQEGIAERYYKQVIQRMERSTGISMADAIIHKSVYLPKDFIKDYHAFQGNAYGLANTLRQTGPGKPRIRNKHISNFYYTGQMTIPGPGLPPSLISGEIVAKHLDAHLT